MKNYFAGFSTFALENAAIAFILGTIYTIAWTPESFKHLVATFIIMFGASFIVVMAARMIKLHIER